MTPRLSIVMPFFRRIEALRAAYAVNSRWFDEGIEVVIANDDPSDMDALVEFVRSQHGRWRVVQNLRGHDWRNPAKAINVGVRHAAADVVLIVSPETRFVSNVPQILLEATHAQPAHYHFGEVAFGEQATPASFRDLKRWTCGSLCVHRRALNEIGGYDESLVGWGGDDDNVRARLRLHGVFGVRHESAMLLHPCMSGSHRVYSSDTKQRLREIVKPSMARWTPGDDWGRDFDHILYDSHPA